MTSNNTFREWVLLKEAKGMLKENLDKVYDNYLKPMLNGIIEKSNNEPKFLTKPQKAEILSLAGHTEMPESFYPQKFSIRKRCNIIATNYSSCGKRECLFCICCL